MKATRKKSGDSDEAENNESKIHTRSAASGVIDSLVFQMELADHQN
jgi:hypothetical protein